MISVRYLTASLLLTQLTGCDLGCDAYASFLLHINVLDSRTEQPLAVPSTLVIYSRAVGDSLVLNFPASPSYSIPQGSGRGWSGGRYSVEIRATGFQTWRLGSDVRVGTDGCGHTKPETITALLHQL